MKYLALDPGNTTGWAVFDTNTGRPTELGECKYGEELVILLQEKDVSFYVVENYRIRPRAVAGFAHEWSEVLPARAIGYIEFHAISKAREVIYQEPSIKPIVAQRFGLPNKGSHQMDAVLHGAYYAWKELKLAPTEHETERKDPAGPRVRRPTRVALISGYSGLRKAGGKAGLQVPKDKL